MNNKVAILYQANLLPEKDGIQKPMKPGGYSDSGADIASQLMTKNVKVITPLEDPKPNNDKDWVFPDTKDGIELALKKGANTFWLNTVLYEHHPIEKFYDRNIEFLGQTPKSVDVFDDKIFTNNLLKSNKIPIPKTEIITKESSKNKLLDLKFPLVLKPIRGRGSQGVIKIENLSKKAGPNKSKSKNQFKTKKYLICIKLII